MPGDDERRQPDLAMAAAEHRHRLCLQLRRRAALSPADAEPFNPTIYFIEPGTYDFTSSCQYPDGTTGSFVWSFVITSPSGQVNWNVPGAAGFYPNPDRISFGQANPAAPGIVFDAMATNATGVDGWLAFLQIVNAARYVGLQAGQPARPCPANGRWVLDGNCASSLPFYGGNPTPLPSGQSAAISMSDTPTVYCQLPPGTQLNSAGVQGESFQTCLMFQPEVRPGCDVSIWIPLAQANWQWTCNVYAAGGSWISFGSPLQSASATQVSFLEWGENICNPANTDWGLWRAEPAADG